MTERVACPACGRGFVNSNAVFQHLKTMAGRDPEHMRRYQRGLTDFRKERRARRVEEPESMADIALEAEIKRLTGEPLDPLERSLLP